MHLCSGHIFIEQGIFWGVKYSSILSGWDGMSKPVSDGLFIQPKDIAHLWELGGGMSLSDLVQIPISPVSIRYFTYTHSSGLMTFTVHCFLTVASLCLFPGLSLSSWSWTCLNPTPCGQPWRLCCRQHKLSWRKSPPKHNKPRRSNRDPNTRRPATQQHACCLKTIL